MPGRQAKIINSHMLRQMLTHVRKASAYPSRDRVIVLLSAKAGLRACEIARLDWSMVLDPRGRIGDTIAIHDAIAKKGSGRRVPMHPRLREALATLMRETAPVGPIITSARGGGMRANSIVNWFVALFAELGLEGCSSHSGRRSFITSAARNVHRAGCSLRDVQLLAGHRSIEMTQRYIDGDTRGQRKLVTLV
jgi:integrase/recombinase XerD